MKQGVIIFICGLMLLGGCILFISLYPAAEETDILFDRYIVVERYGNDSYLTYDKDTHVMYDIIWSWNGHAEGIAITPHYNSNLEIEVYKE